MHWTGGSQEIGQVALDVSPIAEGEPDRTSFEWRDCANTEHGDDILAKRRDAVQRLTR